MSDTYDIVIAGAGIAGLTAGMTAARLGRKTLVLTGGVPGGHLLSIDRIEGYPGFPEGVSGYELCPMVQEQATEAGAEFGTGELQQLLMDGADHLIITNAGQYHTHSVILATGTRLKQLGIPGEQTFRGKGVSQCASCDAPLLRDRIVAVVGGGDSAMQEALTLAESATRVHILHRGPELSGQSTYQTRVGAHPKITIHFHTVVEEIMGANAVTALRLRDVNKEGTSELEVAGVFIFIGMQPNAACLDGLLVLDQQQRIPVDGQLRTTLKGVCAAGIVRAGSQGRAVCSAADGASAAMTADRYLHDGTWPANGQTLLVSG